MNLKSPFRVAAILAAMLAGIRVGAVGFTTTATYNVGQFADVPETEWYASSVASAYELGFMKGTDADRFSPEGSMSVAEAVTIASRVYDAYHAKGTSFSQDGANWYDGYVSYAVQNGIIEVDTFDDYERSVKRSEMAVIFANAVPSDYLTAQNAVNEIPDVPETDSYFEKLLLLYNAGVIMGNDEYGTFLPNNDITRAEAAAIIGRVALPEKRLQKQLTDANYGDAYYLINDLESGFKVNDVGSSNQSAWFVDKRFTESAGSSTGLSDFSIVEKVEVHREFDRVESGLLGLDFITNLQVGSDTLYFRITDAEKNALMSLETRNGHFYLNGTDTDVEIEDERYYMTVKMDLDEHTALLYVNGKAVEKVFTLPEGVAERFYVGSDQPGTGFISFEHCALYKDYPINERFLVPENSGLAAWNVTGEAKVVRTGGEIGKDTNSAVLSAGATASQSFRKLSGSVVFETLMLFPTAEDTGYIRLKNGDTTVAHIDISADAITAPDGSVLHRHTHNIWQTLRIEADTLTGQAVYKINGKVVGTFAFENAAATVDCVEFGATGGSVYFDDVTVFMTHEYEDYCPEPQPIGDDGYDVWMNMCPLWSNGSGWGAISAYPDIEPVLGYYDEGITEVSDWEIKFMVENGIDVQHICWYSPTHDQKEPIKKPQLVYRELHDGFFHAKYSNLMKFALMWENNGTDVYSLEQFKEYIWNYWLEYYFTDERYYTIDNKVVFTVWSYPNFKKSFGDTAEGAREAIAFMNEDIQKYGYDGVMVIFFDYHKTDEATFRAIAEMGAEAAYAYHWIQDGNKYETTINRLENNAGFKALHIIPTVSVGFNNLGWSGTRKPMITVEDHKKVLEYIKDTYLPRYEGWKSKTVVVSTWNEYGEGTYVMPCEGLHGFSYLENVAEVLYGVTDHSSNIVPTEQQKARLGHMFPKTKTALKRYDIEQPEPIVADKVLYTATGADMKAFMHLTDDSGADGTVFKGVCTTGDPALLIKDEALFAPIEAEKVAYVRLKMKADTDSVCDIFFLTEASKDYDSEKQLRATVKVSDDFTEYTFDTSACAAWKGKITALRIDPISGSGSFEVASLEFLGAAESTDPTLVVEGKAYTPVFSLKERNGEIYATAEANSEFFARHHLYYVWNRHNGTLLIEGRGDSQVIFTVGSDKALVNGKEVALKEAVGLKDGLPIIPLCFLYDSLGIDYTLDGKLLSVTLYKSEAEKLEEEKYNKILEARVPYEYEFEIPGDTEGWKGTNTSVYVQNGILRGSSIINAANWYDPILKQTDCKIDTSVYNQITLRIKYDSKREKDEKLQVFFITDKDKNWNEDKCFNVPFEKPSSDGQFIEYKISCAENKNWSGTVTELRIDPLTYAGSYELDYFRITEDLELKAQKEKEQAEKLARGFELINGDAEDPDNVAFFNESTIDIVKDEDSGSFAYRNMANAAYNYSRQSVVWDAGKTYKVSVDFKLLSNKAGKTDFTTQVMFNARYTDADGKYDHAQKLGELSPSDGWKTFTFTFEIPDGVEYHENDEFSFYLNPADNQGVNYLFDNVKVTVK